MTAEELFNKIFTENSCYIDYDKAGLDTIKKAMIEFTKLHVTEALKEASEKGYSLDWRNAKCEIDKESILNSYPLTNIK